MKYIMLLFVFTSWDNGLQTTQTVSIKGYPDMVACERHLNILRRDVVRVPGAEIVTDDCFAGIR